MVKNPPANVRDAETQVQSLGSGTSLKKEMVTSIILAWEIPWTEELGRLQSMELQRVRHNFSEQTTSKCPVISIFIFY